MTQEPSYGKRLHKAARDEFKAFWSAYRNWVTAVSFLAFLSPAILQIVRHGWRSMVNLDETITNGVLGLIVSLLSLSGTYLIALRRGAENLDSALHGTIQQHEQKLRELAGKPVRTPAEEHHFKKAQEALQGLGEQGRAVLRHLANHDTLIFTGVVDPPLPTGMTRRDTQNAIEACVNEDLVTRRVVDKGGGHDYVYQIAPGMKAALDELLYQ